MEMEYKHKIAVNADAWYIRAYVWLWDASPEDINICKLFWGYLFFVPALIIKMIAIPIILLFTWIAERLPERSVTTREPVRVPPPRKERTGPTTMQKVLNGISGFFSWLLFRISQAWGFVTQSKRLNRIILTMVTILAALISLAGVAWVVYMAITHLNITLIVLAVTGLVVVGIGIVMLLIYLGQKLAEHYRRKPRREGPSFKEIMRRGYIAVKTNTCPQVVVNGLEPTTAGKEGNAGDTPNMSPTKG